MKQVRAEKQARAGFARPSRSPRERSGREGSRDQTGEGGLRPTEPQGPREPASRRQAGPGV